MGENEQPSAGEIMQIVVYAVSSSRYVQDPDFLGAYFASPANQDFQGDLKFGRRVEDFLAGSVERAGYEGQFSRDHVADVRLLNDKIAREVSRGKRS